MDIASALDLRKMSDARAWAESAMQKRPWREELFHVFLQELGALDAQPLSVLELGSGPGFLIQRVLQALPSVEYWALDFSEAMHELARERLGLLAERVRFIQADFKRAGWESGLPQFSAVISLQAVHELRHKRHAPGLFAVVRELIAPGGVFLVCDHFAGPGGMSNAELYMSLREQQTALHGGGFECASLILQKGGLALWRAQEQRRPRAA